MAACTHRVGSSFPRPVISRLTDFREHVHADVAATEPGNLGVEKHYGQYCDRAQALDIRAGILSFLSRDSALLH